MNTLFKQLRSILRGTVRDDTLIQTLYASDASIYQIQPLGMVAPADEGDVLATLRLAREYGVSIIGRGGATSLAGQTVGTGLQLDVVPFLNRVRSFDLQDRSITVQPGIVLDELNGLVAQHNVMFAPDVAPANRATIGGMIGNNSCGMYSVVYGKTIDHVQRLKVVLSDGTLITAQPLNEAEYTYKLQLHGREGAIYRGLREIIERHRSEILQRFPKLLRRVGGYNLDRLAQTTIPNLVDLLVGSEGTLALTLEATLRLVERPQARGIAVLHFTDLLGAVDCVPFILEQQPVAIELLDDLLLRLTANSSEYGPDLQTFVVGQPAAILLVEFWAESQTTVREQLEAFVDVVQQQRICDTATLAVTATERAAITRVRKAGQPLLMAYAPDKKPQTCVEDSAVPPEKLGAYVRRFQQILADHKAEASFYGHASVGLLHVRPLLNLYDPGDVRKLRSLSEAVCEAVLEFDGALSGEHGDGLLRSEFNERIFGPELYQAFREVKALFDPLNLFNPGKITGAPALDINLRPEPTWQPATMYRFAETKGIVGAVELCNGNGLCRKTITGTMCPSYIVTRQEEHSTRGRANALRAVFSGALAQADLSDSRVHEALDMCLACKACTAECPSRVNMTRLKSEALFHRHQTYGTPLRSWFFAQARLFNQLGSKLAPFSNWPLDWQVTKWIQEKLLGVAKERTLPNFARYSFWDWWKQQTPLQDSSKTVVLFVDSWTGYQEPEIAQAAVEVLWVAGYSVLVPQRSICCGRPALSKGLLRQAVALAQQHMEWLAPYAEAGLPIVGLEPSCILSFRDEYPDLLDDLRTQVLAQHSWTFEEFIARESQRHDWALQLRPATQAALVHQHCHAKALAQPASLAISLDLVPNFQWKLLDSGCCGMAGSFGYEREHYYLSQQIGQRVLFPAIEAAPEHMLIAPGTSCRQQIWEATGRRALHPAQFLRQQLFTQ